MEVDCQQRQSLSNGLQETATNKAHDLVGGPFAVIESDPGVFTSLTRRLGIHDLELVEMYDIEPWAVDHLNPHGLIFCFMWKKDAHRPTDFNDPAAERVWFANQLSDDACATHALLNVLLNCPRIDVGDELRMFREETKAMSPVMRGLAITNSPIIRPAHNSLARPSDIRASINNLTITTFEAQKRKEKERKAQEKAQEKASKPPPAKKAKVTTTKSPNSKAKTKGKAKAKAKDTDVEDGESEDDVEDEDEEVEEETYHFIGYVPAHGKVWELDGLKSGPLEVGELPDATTTLPGQGTSDTHQGWMDVVRPALRMKMEKYGGSANDGSNIRFSLLAIVDDLYCKASDELEFYRRDKIALERQLNPGWDESVDSTLLESSRFTFVVTNRPTDSDKPYAKDFGARRMERDMAILKMSQPELLKSWETCIQNAMRAKVAVEDEISKSIRSNTDHVKRVFDYEPFIREYLQSLHREGLLNPLLDRDNDGKKKKRNKAAKPKE